MRRRDARRAPVIAIAALAACLVATATDAGEPADGRALALVLAARTASASDDGADRATAPPIDRLVRRDPFDGAPAAGDDGGGATAASDSASTSSSAATDDAAGPMPVDVAAAAGVTVPNIDPRALDGPAPGVASAGTSALVVRATISGRHPAAVIADGDDVRVVGIGDEIGRRRVAAIDLDGVRLSDGTRLTLPGAYRGAPVAPHASGAPSPSRADAALAAIARLSELLARREKTRAAASTPSAQQPFGGGPPTPAPLPTVDARGLAPGVNPTPDLADPTAMPYPYPYAPAVHR